MNLSNYPPGVTGNEDYFNPRDEDEDQVEPPDCPSCSDNGCERCDSTIARDFDRLDGEPA